MAFNTTLAARWPTALGLLLAAGGIAAIVLLDAEEERFGPGVATMSGIYLAAFALGRPAAAWIAFPVLSALSVPLTLLDIDTAIGMTAVTVVLWLWALLRGRAAEGRWFTIQTAGMVVFGAITVLTTLAEARLGVFLAGLGFFGHGLWDAYHFKANRVVNRPWSEACVVVDLPVGVALMIVALAG